ncbi:photosynthetic complex assembly protein PuhC [Acidisoma sp.]|uniref:photosynthetic complex assembly protein PuhC n=1 Tax=Acidisoma sp. TaxID=1872115 RepID=UPI003B00D4E1
MSATSHQDRPSVPYYKLPWSRSFTAPAGSPGHRRIAWPPVIAAAMVLVAGGIIMLPGKPLPTGATISVRSFRIDQKGDGVIAMRDARTGATLDVLQTNGDGFMRGVLHSIALRREKAHMSQETPLTLTATGDGRLILSDPPTDTMIDLEAFGSANEAAFARLLPHPAQHVAAREASR